MFVDKFLMRNPTLIGAALLLNACGPETPVPDDTWNVSVTGDFTDADGEVDECTGSDPTTYAESFVYQVFYNGANVQIRINDEDFATGTRTGCDFEYQSAAYLEEAAGGNFQWQISGAAEVQAAAGACLSGEFDWEGTEVIEVIFSENESIPVGCQYRLQVTGTYQGN